MLKRAEWLTSRRIRAYGMMLALAFVGMLIATFFRMQHEGSDFLAFWSAAKILASHGASAVYDLDLQARYQTGAGFDAMIAYVNPPPYLFFVAWLAPFSFPTAWIAWTLATFLVWFAVARSEWKGDLTWPLVAFPAAYLAASHAQNGFVTGAILVGGVLMLRRSPFAAGAIFGLLVIKPHLALLVPFWLLARREWSALAGGVAGAAACILLSLAVFGIAPWQHYPQSFEVSAALMASGPGEFWLRMATPYAALRQHADADVAMVAQAAISLAAIALVMICSARERDVMASGALMLAATAIASPYLFSYDLPFLVLPVFWLITDGRARGFRPYEKVAIALLYLSPLATRALAIPIGINLMPFAALAMVLLIASRLPVRDALPDGEEPCWRTPKPAG
ncbi:hypothetical protein B2G71_15785 [Novosphingobium sp. PC22D]|uniref:glycosyltransferase family 87 protein n=1 Tax=Novosphingobium sp. PC22D TaxID=1962403 RepID=UPI000BEF5720|nr:glycosyltransferase family 87 protein [Novosphingobium sp. PC22D]PEQ11589.1 hypothetical protein B2G71_15785 [Novosphingobium sp. PC22D]